MKRQDWGREAPQPVEPAANVNPEEKQFKAQLKPFFKSTETLQPPRFRDSKGDDENVEFDATLLGGKEQSVPARVEHDIFKAREAYKAKR